MNSGMNSASARANIDSDSAHVAKLTERKPAVHTFKLLTLNMHKGFSVFNRAFVLPELRDALREESVDVVFLQEVHGSHLQHAQRHPHWPAVPQYEYLAESMWPEYSYGRNAVYPQGDHGNALLSKFPIMRYQNLDVSIGTIEQRGLLHSVLNIPGHDEVHAICVHLGLRENHRQQQLYLLRELVESLPATAPVIVAGDFNDWRKKADSILVPSGLDEVFVGAYGKPAKSFPARLPLLSLDRIYVRNARASRAKVLHQRPWSHLSDHAPLAVEVHL